MNKLPDRVAAVVGIDDYRHGVAPLRTAVADARAIGEALEADHGYRACRLFDAGASREGILRLLEQTLPPALGPDSGLVIYYAGHGLAEGDGSGEPQGYLLPQDSRLDDASTWLSMDRVRQALAELPCRHLLAVLDCCYAGSFRWTSTRGMVPTGRPLYDSQYNRYLMGTAWQVLTSASHDEKAIDLQKDNRGEYGGHSPFAGALLRGLAGDADSSRGRHDADGVMTVTELYQYVFEELVPPVEGWRQTPGLWPLKPDNTGEFIFLSPRQQKQTRPDPPLDESNNPWPGLEAYSEEHVTLFFGRNKVVEELIGRLEDSAASPLLALVGASGTGKSSVVRAGILPRLTAPGQETAGAWTVVSFPRLGADPRRQLEPAERLLDDGPREGRKLLFIDQFEELFSQCPDAASRAGFLERLRQLMMDEAEPLRVLLTVRSDFEPRMRALPVLADLLARGRYFLPGLTSDELREIIEQPAAAKALYFEPPELIGELVDEVMAMPGALPLLSFALAEMYRQASCRRRQTGALDRALTRQDYEVVGGVVGALHQRAGKLIEVAEGRGSVATVRRVALRMVSLEGGRVSRRRIHRRELLYAGGEEQARVARVIRTLTEARLVVADESYLEPAHDTLVQAWPRLTSWLAEAAAIMPLLRAAWAAAEAWQAAGRAGGLLWHEDPRLGQIWEVRTELNRLEQEFVVASRRRRRRRLAVVSVAAVIAFLAGTAAYLSSARVDAICGGVRPDDPLRTARRLECFEPGGATLTIEWNGGDVGAQPVPGGVYVLRIEGEMPREISEPLHDGKDDE